MNLVFGEMFGIGDGFAKVEFSGRTDLSILCMGLAEHDIEGGLDAHLDEFCRRYYALLPQTLKQKPGHLMPGFPQLLDRLSAKPDVRLGLATGNFREGGRLKLQHYGIADYFIGGGFGEESLERADVVGLAIERLAGGVALEDVLVIGDTPLDVSAALANGAVAVGVATGNYSSDQLREAGAQVVFEDFSDWQNAAATLAGTLSAAT
jgi:phosphoglycolate phosphatase-like HAD superfamily hydrolase